MRGCNSALAVVLGASELSRPPIAWNVRYVQSQKGVASNFCWVCLGKWKGTREENNCGNWSCNGIDKRIIILAECPMMQICGQSCPSVRGCPKCGLLIEFIDKCNQMQCRACQCYFCFLCLKTGSTSQELNTTCVSYQPELFRGTPPNFNSRDVMPILATHVY